MSIPDAMRSAAQYAESYSRDVKDFFQLAQTDTISDLLLDESGAIGYTYKTMAAGLLALHHASSFEDGLIQIVNQGGDADTNGAVTGALLGAKYGFSAIPLRFVIGLLHKDLLDRKIVLFTDSVLNGKLE